MNFISGQDSIAGATAGRFHYKGAGSQQTVIGGIFSMFAMIFFYTLAWQAAKRIYTRGIPMLSTLNESFEYTNKITGEANHMNLDMGFKIMINIRDHAKRFPYDDTYIMMYARRTDVTYTKQADGTYKAFNKRSSFYIHKCREDEFMADDYEKQFYKNNAEVYPFYCLDKKDIEGTELTISGTKDSKYAHEDHSYFVLYAYRCYSSSNYKPVGFSASNCKSESDIDDYTDMKFIQIRVISRSFTYKGLESDQLSPSELVLPGAPLNKAYCTSAGHRFRWNYYENHDRIYSTYFQQNENWYDYVFYNFDIFTCPSSKKSMGTMFRIDTEQIHHIRYIETFLTFIACVSGVMGFYLEVFGWIIGDYENFNAVWAIAYSFPDENGELNEPPLGFKIKTYLAGYTLMGKCCCCCLKNEEHNAQVELLNKREEDFTKAMDLHEIVSEIRNLGYFQRQIIKHLHLDPKQPFYWDAMGNDEIHHEPGYDHHKKEVEMTNVYAPGGVPKEPMTKTITMSQSRAREMAKQKLEDARS